MDNLVVGHKDVNTTMISTHVMAKGPAGGRSPLDLLSDLAGDDIQAAVEATRRLGAAAPGGALRHAPAGARGPTCANL